MLDDIKRQGWVYAHHTHGALRLELDRSCVDGAFTAIASNLRDTELRARLDSP